MISFDALHELGGRWGLLRLADDFGPRCYHELLRSEGHSVATKTLQCGSSASHGVWHEQELAELAEAEESRSTASRTQLNAIK